VDKDAIKYKKDKRDYLSFLLKRNTIVRLKLYPVVQMLTSLRVLAPLPVRPARRALERGWGEVM